MSRIEILNSQRAAHFPIGQIAMVLTFEKYCQEAEDGLGVTNKNAQQIASEWGFRDPKVAEMMLKKRLKYQKLAREKEKRDSLLDPEHRLARFRRVAAVLRHTVPRCNTLQHAAIHMTPITALRSCAVLLQFCVLKYIAVCCNVLQCAAVCCRVLPCVAVCCRVLPCVVVC